MLKASTLIWGAPIQAVKRSPAALFGTFFGQGPLALVEVVVAGCVLQIARFGSMAICDLNPESQVTSDLKGSALPFCCNLKGASNHKSRDLKARDLSLVCSNLGEILAIWALRFEITSVLRFAIWST